VHTSSQPAADLLRALREAARSRDVLVDRDDFRTTPAWLNAAGASPPGLALLGESRDRRVVTGR